MSNAKMLMGLMVMFGLMMTMFGALAVGQCGGNDFLAQAEFKPVEGAWFPQLDYAANLVTQLTMYVAAIFLPCSGMTWTLILLVPMGIVILYIGIEAVLP